MRQTRTRMYSAIFLKAFAIIAFICGTIGAQAQVMKAADLEKYAKQRYGDKWLDAAKNLASELNLDKNESLTYQQVIEAPGKTKQQLYVTLNYWATATFKDKQAITLDDKDAGCIIISSRMARCASPTRCRTTTSLLMSVEDGSVRLIITTRPTETPSGRGTTPPMPIFMMNHGRLPGIILSWIKTRRSAPVPRHSS